MSHYIRKVTFIDWVSLSFLIHASGFFIFLGGFNPSGISSSRHGLIHPGQSKYTVEIVFNQSESKGVSYENLLLKNKLSDTFHQLKQESLSLAGSHSFIYSNHNTLESESSPLSLLLANDKQNRENSTASHKAKDIPQLVSAIKQSPTITKFGRGGLPSRPVSKPQVFRTVPSSVSNPLSTVSTEDKTPEKENIEKVEKSETHICTQSKVLLGSGVSFKGDVESAQYKWSLLAKPSKSQADLTDPYKKGASIVPDVEGIYMLKLEVFRQAELVYTYNLSLKAENLNATAQWEPVENAVGYNIYLKASNDPGEGEKIFIPKPKTNSYLLKTLKKNENYKISISALVQTDEISIEESPAVDLEKTTCHDYPLEQAF